MAINKNREGQENREHWEFVESTSNRVDNWPAWKLAATTTVRVEPVVESRQAVECRDEDRRR